MSKLHIECVELHRERRKLIKKLADIQNAQQLINGIGDEINSIKNDTSYIPSEQYASNAHSKRIQDISTNDMNLLRFKAAEAIDK